MAAQCCSYIPQPPCVFPNRFSSLHALFWGSKCFGSSAHHTLSITLCLLNTPRSSAGYLLNVLKLQQANAKCCFYCLCLQVTELLCTQRSSLNWPFSDILFVYHVLINIYSQLFLHSALTICIIFCKSTSELYYRVYNVTDYEGILFI